MAHAAFACIFSHVGIVTAPVATLPSCAAGLQVRVNLWDLAGSPDYLEVRNEFYKDAQVGTAAQNAQ